MKCQSALALSLAAMVLNALSMQQASAAEPVYLSPGRVSAKTGLHNQSSVFKTELLYNGVVSTEMAKNSAPRSSSNLSESVATLNHYNTPGVKSKLIELNTKASALGSYRNASAEMRTTLEANGNLKWVSLKVGPGSKNDRQGKPVTVTLNLIYTGTINGSSGRNTILVAYWDGYSSQGRFWADGSMTASQNYTGTRTFQSTVGSTFAIALYNESKATANTTAVSNIRLTVATDSAD